MLVVLKKIGTVLGDMTFQVLTLGGALDGVYNFLYNLNASSIQTISKIIALTAGMVGLKKAINGIRKFGKLFEEFAIKGGYKTQEMLEAERFEAAQNRKVQASSDANTQMQAQEQARHNTEMKNNADEINAVNAKASAAETAAYRQAQTQNTQISIMKNAWDSLDVSVTNHAQLTTSAIQASSSAINTENNALLILKRAWDTLHLSITNHAQLTTSAMTISSNAVSGGAAQVTLLNNAWKLLPATITSAALTSARTMSVHNIAAESGILKRKKVSHKMKKFLIVLSLLGAMLVQAEDSEIWGALVGSSACQSYGSKAPA